MKLSRLFFAIPICTIFLGLASCKAPAPTWGSGLVEVKAPSDIAKLEREMWKRVNEDRLKEGLPPLSWDARLADIARSHSQDMKISSFFGHVSPNTGHLEDRMNRAGYLNAVCRENVAIAPDVQLAEDGFLKSPGHRANLLSADVNHIGIGIVRGDSAGHADNLTITQVFAAPVDLESPERARNILLERIASERDRKGLKKNISDAALMRLAQKYIPRLADDLSRNSLAEVNKLVAGELARKKANIKVAIAASAHLILSAKSCTLPEDLLDETARRFGIAAAKANDEQGQPRLKLLVLIEKH